MVLSALLGIAIGILHITNEVRRVGRPEGVWSALLAVVYLVMTVVLFGILPWERALQLAGFALVVVGAGIRFGFEAAVRGERSRG